MLFNAIINFLIKGRKKKSFSLILVLFALSAFSALAVIMLYISSHWMRSSLGQVQQLQSYYLAEAAKNIFLERHISFTYDFSSNPGRFTGDLQKTLGGASYQLQISYPGSPAARGPLTMSFFGRVLNNGAIISESGVGLTVSEDETQNQNILSNLRNFNGYFDINRDPPTFSCVDFWGNTRIYNNDTITLMASCICWDCNGNCGCCATAQSEIYMAKTYFNANVNLKTVNYTPYPKIGSFTSNRNIFVKGFVNLSGLGDPATNGIWGNLYRSGYFTDTSPTGMHGNNYYCPTGSTDPNCVVFNNPPTKPALDTTAYDLLIAKAETVPAGDLTISSISSPFGTAGLGLRNIFINGNVTINSSSTYPLLGPGTIVATGNIILGNNVNIRDQITLVAKGNIYNLDSSGYATGPAIRIGGILGADDFINGYGVIMYARGNISIYGNGDSFAANQQPRVKAFLFSPNVVNFPVTGVSGSAYLNRYSQLQGLIYARTNSLTLSNLHGNIYVDDIQLWDLCGAFWAWKGHAITIMRLYDTVGSGVSTNYYLPIRLEGLYQENVAVSFY